MEPYQWITGTLAAFLVGVSKTGVPGIGILVVPLLGIGFGGRLGAGVMLPLLIMGDVFAVTWYRRHCQWEKLATLLPWVVVGLAFGTAALWITGGGNSGKDVTDVVIGGLVAVMVLLHIWRNRLGDRLTPTSSIGTAGTGVAAGFATMVSNAAGPVMQMYLAAYHMPKEQFMGTIAWYFFIINLSKFPIYVILSRLIPQKPLVTASSLTLNAMVLPAVLAGVFIGKWLLPRISQKAFETIVVMLSFAGAANLIARYLMR